MISTLERSPTTNAMVRTTTAVTTFQAGTNDNVLPSQASAVTISGFFREVERSQDSSGRLAEEQIDDGRTVGRHTSDYDEGSELRRQAKKNISSETGFMPTPPGSHELPALVNRLKLKAPETYHRYFGQFGLDTTGVKKGPGTLPVGFFTLDGTVMRTEAQKERLRELDWPYRFWVAGHDDIVREVEIEHATQSVLDSSKIALAKAKSVPPAKFDKADVASELLIIHHTADELIGVFDPPLDPIEYHGVPRTMTQLEDDAELVLRGADGRNFLPWYSEKSASLTWGANRLVSNWRRGLNEIPPHTDGSRSPEEIYIEDVIRGLRHVHAYARTIFDMTTSHQVLIWEVRFGPENSN